MVYESVPFEIVAGRKSLVRAYSEFYYGGKNAAKLSWEPAVPFAATLEFEKSDGGVFFVVDRATGVRYNLLASYVVKLIKRDLIRSGAVEGLWQVYKRRNNYAVMLVE